MCVLSAAAAGGDKKKKKGGAFQTISSAHRVSGEVYLIAIIMIVIAFQ